VAGELFFTVPLMFRKARQTCKTISAYALALRPQIIHITLLKRKSQNPQVLLSFVCEATSQAATTVTSIAGHCIASREIISALLLQPRGKRPVESTVMNHARLRRRRNKRATITRITIDPGNRNHPPPLRYPPTTTQPDDIRPRNTTRICFI